MSIRHEYSYWLTAKPIDGLSERCDELFDALRKAEIAMPEGPLFVEIDVTRSLVSGEVNPNWGTIQEDEELLEKMTKIAAQFPDFDIEFKEIDEEDKSQERLTIWRNGTVSNESVSRVVPADTQYDNPTVQAIADFVRNSGNINPVSLADDILANFLNK